MWSYLSRGLYMIKRLRELLNDPELDYQSKSFVLLSVIALIGLFLAMISGIVLGQSFAANLSVCIRNISMGNISKCDPQGDDTYRCFPCICFSSFGVFHKRRSGRRNTCLVRTINSIRCHDAFGQV